MDDLSGQVALVTGAGALAADGIRVLALCPGFADTPLLAAQRVQFGDFPLLTTDDVVGAFEVLLADGVSGEAWIVQPGRLTAPYRFRGVPGPAGGQVPPPIDWEH